MKNFLSIALTALALTSPLSLLTSQAQSYPAGAGIGNASATTFGFGGKGVTGAVVTSVISNHTWFCTSAAAPGVPRVNYIDVTSDMTNALLTFYVVTNTYTITNSAPANTNNISLFAVAGLATNDICLIRNLATDSYQVGVVSNVGATVIGFYQTFTNAPAANDLVYRCTPAGTKWLPCLVTGPGTYNASLSHSSGVWIGQPGVPLLMLQTGSNACAINFVSGDYVRQAAR